jgi:hypothetical protein
MKFSGLKYILFGCDLNRFLNLRIVKVGVPKKVVSTRILANVSVSNKSIV